MADWMRRIDISLTASAFATLPYLLTNAAQIIGHQGNFIHFSKPEAAMLMALIAFMLWLASAAVILVCTLLSRKHEAIGLACAVPILALIGAAIEPNMWTYFLDPMGNGFGYWLFVTGSIATLASALRMRSATGR